MDSIESRIFEFSGFTKQSSEVSTEIARSTLIAMNILAQLYLKQMNGALVHRFLNRAVEYMADSRPVIRVLAIRLLRVFCKKLPSFMVGLFKVMLAKQVLMQF